MKYFTQYSVTGRIAAWHDCADSIGVTASLKDLSAADTANAWSGSIPVVVRRISDLETLQQVQAVGLEET